AQLLLGEAAFHGGAVQRAGELFDAVVAASGHSDPGLALDAQLDHTLQSWTRLGPRAALLVATRARTLAAGASEYRQACAEAAWALCGWLSGAPAGPSAAGRGAGRPASAPSATGRGQRG